MIFGLRTGEILSVFPVLLSVLVSIIEDLSCDWLWVLPFLFSHVVMFWKQQRQQQQQLFKQQRVHAFETAPATAPAATASCECFSFLFCLFHWRYTRSVCVCAHALLICVHCFISTTTHVRWRIHATVDLRECADSPQIQCNTHTFSFNYQLNERACVRANDTRWYSISCLNVRECECRSRSEWKHTPAK